MEFDEAYAKFIQEFGKGKIMVLSSADGQRVSSRMLSVVTVGERFYFQTDRNFRKYAQIKKNPNVALCTDNIQIEGLCTEEGRPTDNTAFLNAYKDCFKGSFERYSLLEDERLFAVAPAFIERWHYIESVPYIEVFDLPKRKHEINMYKGR